MSDAITVNLPSQWLLDLREIAPHIFVKHAFRLEMRPMQRVELSLEPPSMLCGKSLDYLLALSIWTKILQVWHCES
jgi:hypothetical protein